VRIGIISDVHANLDALERVFTFLDADDVDVVLCLGDVVGYGPEPSACIELIRERCVLTLAGNHDHAACGKMDITNFNRIARQKVEWTTKQLSRGELKWLAELPFVAHFESFLGVHGSGHQPERFNYIITRSDAEMSFRALDKALMFFGHTHVPVAYFDTEPLTYTTDLEVPVDPNGKTLVNVGSVGQPRDKDTRASFVVYDTQERLIHFHRLEYDFEAFRKKLAATVAPPART
jgi:predicted phosphodiesterase